MFHNYELFWHVACHSLCLFDFGYQDIHPYSQRGTVLCLLGSPALVLMFPIFQRKGQPQLVPKGNILASQMRSLLSCSGKIFSECISPQWLKKAFGMITGILQTNICHELCNLFSEKVGNCASLKLLGLFSSDLFWQSK